MSIIPSASAGEPRALTIPVPIPDRVAVMIGSCMPVHVLHAEIEAESAKREVLRFRGRPLLDSDDRADREYGLANLARANKILAAWDPRLIVTPKAVAR